MVKINFQNNITKANADTFNTMQDNIEDAIDNINTYSTNEKRIGTWIDGKPLYSCWYTQTLTTTNLANLLSITRSDYGRIWVNTFFTQNNNGSIVAGSYYYDSNDFQRCWIEEGHTVLFQGGSSYPTRPVTIWFELRYTKSID